MRFGLRFIGRGISVLSAVLCCVRICVDRLRIMPLPGSRGILCYKNQWVEMIDDNEFIYSTMFGNETKYYFSDIESLKQNADSMTLHLKNGKIHIESCAVISERFANAINSKL